LGASGPGFQTRFSTFARHAAAAAKNSSKTTMNQGGFTSFMSSTSRLANRSGPSLNA